MVRFALHLQCVEDDADDQECPADDDPDPDDLSRDVEQREEQQDSGDEAEIADRLFQTLRHPIPGDEVENVDDSFPDVRGDTVDVGKGQLPRACRRLLDVLTDRAQADSRDQRDYYKNDCHPTVEHNSPFFERILDATTESSFTKRHTSSAGKGQESTEIRELRHATTIALL